jgi:type I restriction enzyme M protein
MKDLRPAPHPAIPVSGIAKKRAEARARYYTREEAVRVGWNVSHPSKGGVFLEEQEIVDFFPPLRKTLGLERPNFVIISERGGIAATIECKNEFRDLQKAIDEAKEYADTINTSRGFDVKVAIAVAGSPDTFVQTRVFYRVGEKWKPLKSHGYALTQLPSPEELILAFEADDGTTDVQLPSEKEFYDAAIQISRILRFGKIEEAVRPKIIGAIILALYQGDFSFSADVVLEQINANVKAAVSQFIDIPERRRTFLTETLALSTESNSLRPNIATIVHHLERLNIRSIMRSGVDFLGKFYEAFLRYGSDSTKLGIVFTPRHITRFCAELVDVKVGMSIYDPAAGTGGFLVAAFDRMMKSATTDAAKKRARNSLYGSDTNPTVWALSLLNMFFRGDGKSNIEYQKFQESKHTIKFDRVLMNPPFSQEGEPETDFINHALNSLEAGGELAVVVKAGIMAEGELKQWRASLVTNHHVLAVISLPVDLFYPTSAPTVIAIIRAHTPSNEQGTFLAQILNDGYEISKKRRVERNGSQLPEILDLYRRFLTRGTIATIANVACVIQRNNILRGEEICAENWLPSSPFDPSTFEIARRAIIQQITLAIANYQDIVDELIPDFDTQLSEGSIERPMQGTGLADWFDILGGKSVGHKNYPGGSIPYVSSGDSYNSIVEFIEAPSNEIFDTPCITVTAFGQAALQPWRFAARGNGGSAVKVLIPRYAMSLSELIWFVVQINSQRWRFNYGRMATGGRLKLLQVDPPPRSLPKTESLSTRLIKLRSDLGKLWS